VLWVALERRSQDYRDWLKLLFHQSPEQSLSRWHSVLWLKPLRHCLLALLVRSLLKQLNH
jgi:hypothetical protein